MELNANNIVDSDMASFAEDVIAASNEQLVMVDFWAQWCGPCRSLTPLLEKLVGQYDGKLKLVKIDTDANQEIARQFGIRSLPTVFLFFKGKPVDQFMGLQPEAAIREKIDPYLVNQSDLMLQQANAAYEAGQKDAAMAFLQQLIHNEPDNEAAKLQLLQWLSLANRMEEARTVAELLSKESKKSPQYRGFSIKVEFSETLVDLKDMDQLLQELEADNENLDARFHLSLALIGAGRYPEALENLLEIIQRNRRYRDEEPRKTMIKVFEVLGGKGELVTDYRRRLARLLH